MKTNEINFNTDDKLLKNIINLLVSLDIIKNIR